MRKIGTSYKDKVRKIIVHTGFRSCFKEIYSCKFCVNFRCMPNINKPVFVSCRNMSLLPVLVTNYKEKTCNYFKSIIIKESKNIDSIIEKPKK